MPTTQEWIQAQVREDQIERYLENGRDYIDDALFTRLLAETAFDPGRAREVIAKSLGLERLELAEAAALIAIPREHELWQEVCAAAGRIKESVYGNRIVTFAPLYVNNHCVNACEYCGYRRTNSAITRKRLTDEELTAEIEALVQAGHKRLVMVFGEHPQADYDYIAHTMKIAYSVSVGRGNIRRTNINAAPLSIEALRVLHDVGIGTYQVFQETYNRAAYAAVHPSGLKAHYRWRLYSMHRAMEADVDDVGIGALFGIADWRFDLLGLLAHTIDLEKRFGGVGPHTISFPRIEPAVNTPWVETSPWRVHDDDFAHAVAVIRLMVPYTGMIVTAREGLAMRDRLLDTGVTQLDLGSNIGVGKYSQAAEDHAHQQFVLNDTRSLDDGIRWLASRGRITSFCTADYRLGRTGREFMCVAKKGEIQHMCRPNAVLTFKEYLLDYASPETRALGETLITRELAGIAPPALKERTLGLLARIEAGERDLFI
ncbi:MAG: [FeFe] hydrogenase H-cluster radical SAM maturase HydG [Spirochaetota bacterium]|jgi:2-iminoacetate synthase|nr:[FeFe] hydrogenase H-cluster radical SAM maturase HydG [Spirochaetota bacterium]